MSSHAIQVKYLVAAVWALIVGALMAGAAALLGETGYDVALIGALGGLGAAVYILELAAGAGTASRPPQ